ncbi:MAG: tetratricopeptide repeat protein [Sumerlaeia bacterium]
MDNAEKIKRLEAFLEDEEQARDPLTHFMLGREYLEAKRFQQAAASLTTCVQLNPEYSAAYRFLGDAYRKNGEVAKARETYELGKSVANEMGDLQAAKEMEAFLAKL